MSPQDNALLAGPHMLYAVPLCLLIIKKQIGMSWWEWVQNVPFIICNKYEIVVLLYPSVIVLFVLVTNDIFLLVMCLQG